MALTFDRVKQEADTMILLTNRIADLVADLQQFIAFNQDQAIDWNAGSTPSYIEEDGAGNLAGYVFARQDVGNAIGSFSALITLMTNGNLTGLQGDHLGNINKIADPISDPFDVDAN